MAIPSLLPTDRLALGPVVSPLQVFERSRGMGPCGRGFSAVYSVRPPRLHLSFRLILRSSPPMIPPTGTPRPRSHLRLSPRQTHRPLVPSALCPTTDTPDQPNARRRFIRLRGRSYRGRILRPLLHLLQRYAHGLPHLSSLATCERSTPLTPTCSDVRIPMDPGHASPTSGSRHHINVAPVVHAFAHLSLCHWQDLFYFSLVVPPSSLCGVPPRPL